MSHQYKVNGNEKIDLSVIIVNYNTKLLLRQCLKSIYSSDPNINFEVFVVDNASHDGSYQMVKNEFPQVKLIESKKNLGFSGANNLGARACKGKYILFLNPDTYVLGNSLVRIMNFMNSHSDTGALGPQLLNPDGTLQLSCRKFYTPMAILARRTFLGKVYPFNRSLRNLLMLDWDHSTMHEVDWVLAACLMIRRNLFFRIGGFDEKYKLYFEDVDLCFRVKQQEYKIYYVPQAKIIHYHRRESAHSFSLKTIWHIKSSIRFYKKHWLSMLK